MTCVLGFPRVEEGERGGVVYGVDGGFDAGGRGETGDEEIDGRRRGGGGTVVIGGEQMSTGGDLGHDGMNLGIICDVASHQGTSRECFVEGGGGDVPHERDGVVSA